MPPPIVVNSFEKNYSTRQVNVPFAVVTPEPGVYTSLLILLFFKKLLRRA
jgi:hypothetical protein